MKNIALTGSIGSGKTLICSVFEHIGIPCFNADDYAKKCYCDTEFLKQIADEFGKDVIINSVLDRQKLASIVFQDSDKLDKLNSMVHPKVLESFSDWKRYQSAPYVILETAILFEIGWEMNFDKTICIDSPKEISIKRAMSRDNVSRKSIEHRINCQMPIEDKIKKSDYVIFHDNITMLLPQILSIHSKIVEV